MISHQTFSLSLGHHSSFFVLLYLFSCVKKQIQGLLHARQVLYCWATPPTLASEILPSGHCSPPFSETPESYFDSSHIINSLCKCHVKNWVMSILSPQLHHASLQHLAFPTANLNPVSSESLWIRRCSSKHLSKPVHPPRHIAFIIHSFLFNVFKLSLPC